MGENRQHGAKYFPAKRLKRRKKYIFRGRNSKAQTFFSIDD